MTLNCLIVDDEPLALDLLESYVSRTPFLHLIAQCDSAVKALSVIEEEPIDLVFLDIQMPELNGLELSRLVGNKVEMSRAENVSANVPDSIFVKSDYKLIQILLKDILYIEGLKDYIRIQTEDKEGGILTLMSMKSIEDHLPGDIFIRVHRSYIVNINKIKTIERNRIVFGKLYIPISDSYKERFMELLDKRAIN